VQIQLTVVNQKLVLFLFVSHQVLYFGAREGVATTTTTKKEKKKKEKKKKDNDKANKGNRKP